MGEVSEFWYRNCELQEESAARIIYVGKLFKDCAQKYLGLTQFVLKLITKLKKLLAFSKETRILVNILL